MYGLTGLWNSAGFEQRVSGAMPTRTLRVADAGVSLVEWKGPLRRASRYQDASAGSQ